MWPPENRCDKKQSESGYSVYAKVRLNLKKIEAP